MNPTTAAILMLSGLSGPQNGAELLPAPRAVIRMEMPPAPLGFYRPNPYDVWQFYAVGQDGQFKARVIETPEGAFYLYSGEPYPWTSVNMRNRIP